jgi:serine phosphatase RsbU (regulator of sigma subunit)
MTDGITEARRERELFGYDRLIAVAKQAASAETLDGTVQVIVDTAQRFAGGKFQDDVCVLATRFL